MPVRWVALESLGKMKHKSFSGSASLRIKIVLSILALQSIACGLTMDEKTPTHIPTVDSSSSPTDLSAELNSADTPVPGIGTTIPQVSPTTRQNVSLWVAGIGDQREGLLYAYKVSCLDEVLICVVGGQAVTTWPTLITDLAWSPDGAHLAIVAFDRETTESEIYLLDPENGWDHAMITKATSGNATSPFWSSDGKRITFALATESTDVVCEYDLTTTQITREVLPLQGLSGIGSLSQSASGTWALQAYPAGSPSMGVFLYSSSVGLNQIAPSESLPGGAAGPRFSRDGHWLSFVQQTVDQRGTNVMVMAMDGSSVANITQDNTVTNGIAWWSPVSDHLVYLSTRDTGQDLVTDLWATDLTGDHREIIVTPADMGVVTLRTVGWRIDP